MKWFYNIAQSVVLALEHIFDQNEQADKYINKLLKQQKKWGSRDRRFVAKILYDIVRWKRYYEFIANSSINSIEGKWKIIAVWSIQNNIELPDWEEFSHINIKEITNKLAEKNIPQEILTSVPDWLHQKLLDQLKDKWFDELNALNKEAEVVLRVNTLKITVEKLQSILLKNQIETYQKEGFPEALFLTQRKKITHLPAYKKGLFEVQDASSQLVAHFAEVKPGMTVIDACAGAGGKTLHLAARMKNEGQIFAYDIYPSKIEELNKRAKRNAVKILAQTAVITPKHIENNNEIADVLLIDAPCSSLGTLRRKPDLKWKLNPDKITQIKVIQQDILSKYASMLKKNGLLIYVTCSILPEENQDNVKSFLEQNKNFIFVEDKTVLPSQSGHDGFYMAKLLKTQ